MIEESSECHLGWVFCNPDETENYIIPPMCIGTGEEGFTKLFRFQIYKWQRRKKKNLIKCKRNYLNFLLIEPTITKKISNICGFSFK